MENSNNYFFKILVVGDSSVGKTCLVKSFANEKFDIKTPWTVGIDFKIHTIDIDKSKVKLQIWDPSGRERFRTLTRRHYRIAHGIIVTYDVTKKDSFDSVEKYFKDIDIEGQKYAIKLLVGLKSDLTNERVISYEQGKMLADCYEVEFFETSAKSGTAVNDAFMNISKALKVGCELRDLRPLKDIYVKTNTLSIEQMEPYINANAPFEVLNYLFNAMISNKDQYLTQFNDVATYRNKILREEINAAVTNGSCVPIRRGRVTIVGQGGAGKTNTMKALRGEMFHGAYYKSTNCIDVTDNDVDIRGVGIGMTSKDEIGRRIWEKVDDEDMNEKERAFKLQLMNGGGMCNVGTTAQDRVVRRLKSKYGFGNELCDDEESFSIDLESMRLSLSFDTVANNKTESKEDLTLKATQIANDLQHYGFVNDMDNEENLFPLDSKKPNFETSADDEAKDREDVTTEASKIADNINPVIPGVDNLDYNPTLWNANIPEGKEDSNIDSEEIMIDDEYGNRIRVSMWDYGGEDIFSNIQHMHMLRESCYVVVFSLPDLINEETRPTALHHLIFWIKSIEIHAVASDSACGGDTDLSKLYPPIVLVGTHLDVIYKESIDNLGLSWVLPGLKSAVINKRIKRQLILADNVLRAGLGHLSPFQSSKEALIRGRESLFNSHQGLTYFPVDNSDPNDKNINVLRTTIVQAIIDDPLDYVNDSIPLCWLDSMDELRRLSHEKPMLRVSPDNKEALSVIGVMHKCNAFDDTDPKTKNYDDLCKTQAIIFLQLCHKHGAVVYFGDTPGLKSFCILDPQWIIDTTAYVIRNYKLHSCVCDSQATGFDINLWRALQSTGILHTPLLRKLWLGEDDNLNSLANFMVKIGVFAVLRSTNAKSKEPRFLVPGIITTSAPVNNLSLESKIFEHLQIKPRYDKYKVIVPFPNKFLRVGYYNRMVTRLITQWPQGYNNTDPILLPNGCLLYLGSTDHPFALLFNTEHSSIEIVTSSEPIRVRIVPYVIKVMDGINKDFYNGSLQIDVHPDRQMITGDD